MSTFLLALECYGIYFGAVATLVYVGYRLMRWREDRALRRRKGKTVPQDAFAQIVDFNWPESLYDRRMAEQRRRLP